MGLIRVAEAASTRPASPTERAADGTEQAAGRRGVERRPHCLCARPLVAGEQFSRRADLRLGDEAPLLRRGALEEHCRCVFGLAGGVGDEGVDVCELSVHVLALLLPSGAHPGHGGDRRVGLLLEAPRVQQHNEPVSTVLLAKGAHRLAARAAGRHDEHNLCARRHGRHRLLHPCARGWLGGAKASAAAAGALSLAPRPRLLRRRSGPGALRVERDHARLDVAPELPCVGRGRGGREADRRHEPRSLEHLDEEACELAIRAVDFARDGCALALRLDPVVESGREAHPHPRAA
mmetsp:Transcript_26571/g.87468  ORF Transcript_26571/g.87468 Transcript_26571/m.87468 type:complete len:292 (+) Transcript_26571:251-1126(+)